MPFVITMPKLSPTMEEGTIVAWHVKEEEYVEPGQVLMEIATDKATLEYHALDGGYLRKILAEENSTVKVGDAVAVFTEKKEESIAGYEPPSLKEDKEEIKSPSKEMPIPLEKAKETPQGSTIQEPAFVPAPPLEKNTFSSKEPIHRIKASPLARKIAKDQGLDLRSVQGSGPHGRVLAKDLAFAQKNGIASLGARDLPQEKGGSYEEVSPTPMRKAIGKRLQEAKSFIPHFYIHQDVNAAPLLAIREQLKQCDIKLTINDFIIKAVSLALREHPRVNSGYHSVVQKVIYFKTVDISVAVTLEDGLITPIVRHADYKTIGEISQEVRLLAKKAKENLLSPEEYQGGSFTISNMGMFGVSDFVAIINPPQSAILAVAGIEDKPVIQNGKVEAGKVLRITLSLDHRVVDGVDGGKFIKKIQKFLENPAVLLL